ncbi:MAG: glutamate--tRNA ligase [Candidatus Omnitrophota bacterium]
MRVRFAPSPTGFLHIGGARTALFNWMYARSQGGQFILRIEDTDQARSKKEYVDEILDSMKWLGLDWDEIYFQSQRFSIYKEYAERLVQENKAYREDSAIILKIIPAEIVFYDLIRGEIKFDTATIKDQVLIKSDGSPTYSFACVVDDALMNISCVVRGEDHISNTPKQIVIYQALGLKIPKFAHLPLIMDEEGGRMSKRFGAVAVTEYRNLGFVPEAIVNYLMLLGWSPGENQEIVKLSDAVKRFSIKKINKTAAVFSMDKLRWINSQYIKKMETAKLAELLKPFLTQKGYAYGNTLESIVKLFQGRLATLTDFLDWADFIFVGDIQISEEIKAKFFISERKKDLIRLIEILENLETFDIKATEEAFRKVVAEQGINSSELVHPTRVALTGKEIGPGLFDTMVVLGKEKTIERLRKAKEFFN